MIACQFDRAGELKAERAVLEAEKSKQQANLKRQLDIQGALLEMSALEDSWWLLKEDPAVPDSAKAVVQAWNGRVIDEDSKAASRYSSICAETGLENKTAAREKQRPAAATEIAQQIQDHRVRMLAVPRQIEDAAAAGGGAAAATQEENKNDLTKLSVAEQLQQEAQGITAPPNVTTPADAGKKDDDKKDN